uniref:RING-type domain-containing protein n=1 Tax=Strigamia maritima TaxID=126957 RepID=T1JH44_STRMM
RRICIRDLNPHIVCILCAGYFIDATTITECLHTFCKSCIVKYLQTSKHCPMCNIKIHETQPFINLKLDRVMQDIVYKIVPNLMENEEQRRKDFEKVRGLSHPNKNDSFSSKDDNGSHFDAPGRHTYKYDELINICLESQQGLTMSKCGQIEVMRKFVRCSVRTLILHVKKLLPRVWPILRDKELEVLCDGEVLPDHYCLKYVWLARWTGKVETNYKYLNIFLLIHFIFTEIPNDTSI